MNDIFARRLTNARKMRGLSQRRLSEAMDNIVTSTAIDKYEKGRMFPSSNVVIALSKGLNVGTDYFFKPFMVDVSMNDVEFRKKSNLNKGDITKIKQEVADKLESYIEMEDLSGEKKPFLLNYSDVLISCEDDVLSMANRFRNDLQLGKAGILSPIDILESNGFKIIEIDASSKFDGYSVIVSDIPVIVLNKGFTSERKRFSLFHEVGHLILKFDDDVDKERYCNMFANEVLLPSDVFISKIGISRKDISLFEFIELQTKYGISIDAMLVKARQLDIITMQKYSSIYKKMNKIQKFKDDVRKSRYPKEDSTRYERIVYKLLANEIITISKAANLLGKSVSDVGEELNLM